MKNFAKKIVAFTLTCFCSYCISRGQTNNEFTVYTGSFSNGICAVIDPSDNPLNPIVIGLRSYTRWSHRWVVPSNEVPARVWLFGETGALVKPTNNVIAQSASLRRKWVADSYPHKATRAEPSKYKMVGPGGTSLFEIDLRKYYDLSKGGQFTLKVSPLLYDNQIETNRLVLVELPPATYVFSLTNTGAR